jgi:exosortase
MKSSLDTKTNPGTSTNPPVSPAVPANAAPVKRFTIFAAILTVLFLPVLIPMAIYCAGSELNSYILLVPVIAAYLFNIRRPILPAPCGSSLGWVIAMSALGLAALGAWWHWKPILDPNDSYSIIALSFAFFMAAGGFHFLGTKAMAVASFPFAFLIFLAPMPTAMVDTLETASKLASAQMAGIFFDLFDVPAIQDGTRFELSDISIRVAQECSGIHSSWILLVSSLIAAHLLLRTFWRRASLLIFAVALGIVRNGFRILVIGWLCVNYGPQMIDSPIHHHGGPIFFALSLIPLFLLLWLLCRGDLKAGKLKRASSPPTSRTPASDLQPS